MRTPVASFTEAGVPADGLHQFVSIGLYIGGHESPILVTVRQSNGLMAEVNIAVEDLKELTRDLNTYFAQEKRKSKLQARA